MVAKRNDAVEEYPAMTNGTDANFLQVLLRQVWKDPLVNLVVAECRLVFSRPRLRSQTTMSMPAPVTRGVTRIMVLPRGGV